MASSFFIIVSSAESHALLLIVHRLDISKPNRGEGNPLHCRVTIFLRDGATAGLAQVPIIQPGAPGGFRIMYQFDRFLLSPDGQIAMDSLRLVVE